MMNSKRQTKIKVLFILFMTEINCTAMRNDADNYYNWVACCNNKKIILFYIQRVNVLDCPRGSVFYLIAFENTK